MICRYLYSIEPNKRFAILDYSVAISPELASLAAIETAPWDCTKKRSDFFLLTSKRAQEEKKDRGRHWWFEIDDRYLYGWAEPRFLFPLHHRVKRERRKKKNLVAHVFVTFFPSSVWRERDEVKKRDQGSIDPLIRVLYGLQMTLFLFRNAIYAWNRNCRKLAFILRAPTEPITDLSPQSHPLSQGQHTSDHDGMGWAIAHPPRIHTRWGEGDSQCGILLVTSLFPGFFSFRIVAVFSYVPFVTFSRRMLDWAGDSLMDFVKHARAALRREWPPINCGDETGCEVEMVGTGI